MSARVEERCACGATFRFEPRPSIYADGEARKAAAEWRSQHMHEKPERVRVRIPLARRRA